MDCRGRDDVTSRGRDVTPRARKVNKRGAGDLGAKRFERVSGRRHVTEGGRRRDIWTTQLAGTGAAGPYTV